MVRTFTKTIIFSQVIIMHSIVLNFLQNTCSNNWRVKSIFLCFLYGHVSTLSMMEGQNALLAVFSHVTSTKVGISFQNFWLWFSSLLPHLCKISRPEIVLIPNDETWTKTTPQKIGFFWSNLYKIEVIITSLIEFLEFPNCCHMTTKTI